MQKTLKKVLKKLQANKGCCFYKWTGVQNDKHPLIRLDRVYLNVLYVDKKGTGRFNRIVGYRARAGTMEEEVVFSPELVRVQNGHRKGRILMPGKLDKTENWKPTGVSKVLSQGDRPWTFAERRSGDRQIIELLEGLLETENIPRTSDIFYPTFYLVASERNKDVQLRDTAQALVSLKQVPGYNPMLAPSQNAAALADYLARALPKKKLAWPFKLFCRAGVVAADPQTMNDWTITDGTSLKNMLGDCDG